jgi:hypothetical protein
MISMDISDMVIMRIIKKALPGMQTLTFKYYIKKLKLIKLYKIQIMFL